MTASPAIAASVQMRKAGVLHLGPQVHGRPVDEPRSPAQQSLSILFSTIYGAGRPSANDGVRCSGLCAGRHSSHELVVKGSCFLSSACRFRTVPAHGTGRSPHAPVTPKMLMPRERWAIRRSGRNKPSKPASSEMP